jgi:maleylpyruvate isomerase
VGWRTGLTYSELVDAALRELSDQIDLATQRLLDAARVITEPDLRAPSRLPGWTRAHVLGHVSRGADAMRHLLAGLRAMQDRSASARAQTWQATIECQLSLRPKELTDDLADSAMALRTVARQLPDELWRLRVAVPGTEPFPAAGLLTRRLVEVELHHCDLGAGYSAADWPAAFAAMELPEPMRSQRAERAAYRGGEAALSPPRPPAPWQPGRPLPGSMLGTR